MGNENNVDIRGYKLLAIEEEANLQGETTLNRFSEFIDIVNFKT